MRRRSHSHALEKRSMTRRRVHVGKLGVSRRDDSDHGKVKEG
jgi:hypothetical protein